VCRRDGVTGRGQPAPPRRDLTAAPAPWGQTAARCRTSACSGCITVQAAVAVGEADHRGGIRLPRPEGDLAGGQQLTRGEHERCVVPGAPAPALPAPRAHRQRVPLRGAFTDPATTEVQQLTGAGRQRQRRPEAAEQVRRVRVVRDAVVHLQDARRAEVHVDLKTQAGLLVGGDDACGAFVPRGEGRGDEGRRPAVAARAGTGQSGPPRPAVGRHRQQPPRRGAVGAAASSSETVSVRRWTYDGPPVRGAAGAGSFVVPVAGLGVADVMRRRPYRRRVASTKPEPGVGRPPDARPAAR
jgi:hypothetical protein